MKISCDKKIFQDAIFAASKASGKNLPLRVLNLVLLEAEGSSLSLRATNLDLGTEIRIPAEVTKKGRVAVPHNLVLGYLQNSVNDQKITIESVGENVSLSTTASTVLIKTEIADEFPPLPELSSDEIVLSTTMTIETFTTGLQSVVYASAVSEIKPEFASVYVNITGQDITFAATDSFRLAEKKINTNFEGVTEEQSFLLPAKNAHDIIRILEEKDSQSEIEFIVTASQISIECDGMHVVSRLTDGSFPDYKQIISSKHETTLVVDTLEFTKAIKLATVFADKLNKLLLHVDTKETVFEVRSPHTDHGESNVRVGTTVEGESVDLSINGRYVLDCLNGASSESVSLGFNGPNKALTMHFVGDRSFTYLVMPLSS